MSCVISSKRILLSIIQEGEEMRNKQELEKEQQSIRDEVREWWQELDFERQMLRKEAEATREELKTNKTSLEGRRMDYRGTVRGFVGMIK